MPSASDCNIDRTGDQCDGESSVSRDDVTMPSASDCNIDRTGDQCDGESSISCDVTMPSASDGNIDRTEVRHIEPEVERAMMTHRVMIIDPTTFGLMLDNLDTNVNPRFKRKGLENQQSMHYVHCLAVKDRISKFSQLSTAPYHTCMNCAEKMALQLLPTTESDCELKDIMMMNVARTLVTYVPYFQFSCSDIVDWHKQHQYYQEMSTKSDMVCAS